MTAPADLDVARCAELAAWAREVAKVRREDVVGADDAALARTRENMTAIAEQLEATARWFASPTIPGDGGKLGEITQPRATQQGAATPGQGATAQGAVPAAGNVAEPQLDPTAHRVEHPPSPRSFSDVLSSPGLGKLIKAGMDAQAERTERGLRWILGDAEYEAMRRRLTAELAPPPKHHEVDPPSFRHGPGILQQPKPTPSDGPAIVDLVIGDLCERARVGEAKYGTRLRAGNGRDALVDAYQETLDQAKYLRQEIEERRAAAERRLTADEILEIARNAAAGDRPSYCPDPATFEPHSWVIAAIVEAYRRGGAR